MHWRIAALLTTLVFTTPFAARAEPIEGQDYVLVTGAPVTTGNEIEVMEFFYYGCEFCSRMEPHLDLWLKGLSPDIKFKRVPALRRTAWVPLTRVYFALEQLGEIERLHAEVYYAVHDDGLNLGNSSELMKWAKRFGVDGPKLAELLDSDSVIMKVQRARDDTVAYSIRATPSFVVDGRYMTSAGMTGSVDSLFAVIDGLIERARVMRSAK